MYSFPFPLFRRAAAYFPREEREVDFYGPRRAFEVELPIIQQTYDLILWYVPQLVKFPRNYKFVLGDRIQTSLYDFLDGFFGLRQR